MLIKHLYMVTRPLQHIKNVAIVLLAYVLVADRPTWQETTLAIVALSLVFSGAYTLNSLCDTARDRESFHKRKYYEAIQGLGRTASGWIAGILMAAGVALGFFLSVPFVIMLLLIVIVTTVYSMPPLRFKDRRVLDVLFGGMLTFPLRFVAGWFAFSLTWPPLLPVLALFVAKVAGYLLVKVPDRKEMQLKKVKNSITGLSRVSLIVIASIAGLLAVLSFVVLGLNSIWHIPYIGELPLVTLYLIPAVTPLFVYEYVFAIKGKLKRQDLVHLFGVIYALGLVALVLWLL
jgi:4-hydroxybenzoate polyprenyltransferase